MRCESIFWTGMIVLALCGLQRLESDGATAQAAGGDPQSGIVESYAAEGLEIRDLSAVLRIESGHGDTIDLTFRGPEDRLASIGRQVEGKRLLVRGNADAIKSSEQTVVIGSLTAYSTGGGSTQVIIGGRDLRDVSAEAREPIEALIRVPAGLPVKIVGFRGSVITGDLEGPLTVNLIEGEAELGSVRNAQLSLTGDGRISAQEALGDLSIAVTGSGRVQVQSSLLERLEVGVTGAGAVNIDGTARFASLSLIGSGQIFLAEVERQPVIERIGSGMVSIGTR